MENFNNDEVKKMLEMLKEQAESTTNSEKEVTQATENTVNSADDLTDMLKKQFSAKGESEENPTTDDYSFDDMEEFVSEEETVEKIEEFDAVEEIVEEAPMVEEIVEEDVIIEDTNTANNIDEETLAEVDAILKEETVEAYEEQDTVMDEISLPDDEVISEESINYDEVLEGQQGTVFNEFVEDFTGDLDDVVFEAEITDSHAPNKQYTIFEDWEELMKSKDFSVVEEDIVLPDNEEMEQGENTSQTGNGNGKMHTDYFNPIVSSNDLDAVDIALMVALGGKTELNQTVGFEKIRQAVEETEEDNTDYLEGKKLYGCNGEEYTSPSQNGKIRREYHKNKVSLIVKLSIVGVIACLLLGYEIAGWAGNQFSGVFSVNDHPVFHVFAGLILLVACLAITADKIIRLFKDPLSFSSVSYIAGLVAFVLSIFHDVFIVTTHYATPGQTMHFASVMLILISLIYDLFDLVQQNGVFDIISTSDKKIILEPYGKIRVDDELDTGEMIDTDSYCISRVPSVKKYFTRTQRPVSDNFTGKLIPLVVSFSIAMCVALLLLIVKMQFNTALLGFWITLSFLLICTAIFETEFAFFNVYNLLKKYKTGIIGKSSVSEHGKCNIVYFDDYNVFDKKSVRTKGLKLYDNNEIYRILYHTQAVFSKVGGPLKGVFEFATTEMTHSKHVIIKEISKEGVSAIVDGRTSVLIGTGAFMRSRYIQPSYTASDLRLEEKGEDSIMFIALNGVLGAKLYVTYQFSAEFEKLAKKLRARGVNIGIRSADPNVNNKWAKKYGEAKRMPISIVRPTLKEIKPNEKSIESGVVSTKNVRALSEALMMCIKLDNLERIFNNMRTIALIVMGIIAFALVLLSGINIVTMGAMTIACALCISIMVLITYFYIKH